MAEHGLTYRLSDVFSKAMRTWKLVTLVLLFVLLSAAVIGVVATLKGPDWVALWQSLLFGLLLGWTLALCRASTWRSLFIILFVGLVYILLIPGSLLVELIPIASELVRLAGHTIGYLKGGNADFVPLIRTIQDFYSAVVVIFGRVGSWATDLATGQPVFDPVAATLVWNALVWIVAAWAGWIVEVRRSAFLAALPAVFLCVGTLAYVGQTSFALYLMLGCALLILAMVQQERRREEWDETGMAYPREKGRQVVRVALLATIGLVLISAGVSSISIHRIQEWISERRKPASHQENNLAQSLGILSNETVTPNAFGAALSPGLPRDLLIGSGPELSRQVVMTVAVRNLSSLPGGGGGLPLYWRSFTYDVYTGHGWKSSQTKQTVYQPEQPLRTERMLGQFLLQQDIYPAEDLDGTVYAAGEPVSLNLKVDAAWRSPGDLFGVQMDHSTSYDVVSAVPAVDARTLRAAGQRYPDWVRERFLSLPSEVPDRVKALAIQLTASKSAPYDRAMAIESYLRKYPYTLDVTRPDLNRDIVDYFLFDLKKGYCDYYASAMVVLARAAGIPARLAVGYASGTYNLNSKRFVVTEADAHSWVEVYFPGIGWVPFEPTASRPTLERTTVPIPTTTSQKPDQVPETPKTGRSGFSTLAMGLFAGIIFIGLLVVMWRIAENARLRHLPPERSAAEVYRGLRRFGNRLNLVSVEGDTPYEFAQLLDKRLQEITGQGDNLPFGLRVIRDVDKIVDEIVNINYRPLPPRGVHVLSRWRVLRWQLWLIWMLKNWNLVFAHFKTTIG